jgi:beta-lactam-binding protein with PASTA domain
VLGKPASVQTDGSFSARVSLRAGVNLIDVLASLPHASGATSALRVERYVLVGVPQVLGDSPNSAEAALRAAGLVPRVQSADDPVESLLPLPDQVCSVSPQPQTQVSPGSTVTLSTAKLCGVSLSSGATQAPPARAATPAPGGPGQGNGPGGAGPPGQEKAKPHGHDHGSSGDQGNGNGD